MDYNWLTAIVVLGVITAAMIVGLTLGMWLPEKKKES